MYDYYEWVLEAAIENIIGFNDVTSECKIAFLKLVSEYMSEHEPHTLSDSPYHDENDEFSDAEFIRHMWDLFRWFDESEAREYWDIPDDVKGEGFWQEKYSACNTHNSFVYSDNKSIIAWLDI